jgi:hypothetical protein
MASQMDENKSATAAAGSVADDGNSPIRPKPLRCRDFPAAAHRRENFQNAVITGSRTNRSVEFR